VNVDEIVKATEKITKAGEVILDKFHTLEQIIAQNVSMTNVLADLEHDINVKYAEISNRPENSGVAAAHIKRLWKSETVEEVRLYSMAKGYKSTLKHMEYGGYK
jgi:hypothetical protein